MFYGTHDFFTLSQKAFITKNTVSLQIILFNEKESFSGFWLSAEESPLWQYTRNLWEFYIALQCKFLFP